MTVCRCLDHALQQYYKCKDKWEYMPVVGFAKAFDQTEMAKRTRGTLAQPYEAPNPKCEDALIQYKYALNGEPLFFLEISLTCKEFSLVSCVSQLVLENTLLPCK